MEDRSIKRPRVDVIDTDGTRHPRNTRGIDIMIHASAFESSHIMDGNSIKEMFVF